MLQGKKAVVISERDGVPSEAIAACMEAAGAHIDDTYVDRLMSSEFMKSLTR